MRPLGAVAAVAAIWVAASAFGAGPPAIGEAAPPVTAKAWLNAAKGDEPTPERLKDKVVMIEFWGTWCGPCMRAMPHVQEMHDRYKDRGLRVVAISYEDASVMEPVLAKNGWTMTVGSDPDKTCVSAYGVSSWPTTAVIGKDGKLVYFGAPYDVEAAIEKALGLESSPGTLLASYLGVVGKPEARAALERLVEKAVPDFDVRTWAAGAGGSKDAKVAGKPDVAKSLAEHAKATPERRTAILDQLAAGGPEAFDLAAWARDAMGRDFPITQKEMEEMLAAKRFDGAVDAILDRRPSGAVLGTAAKCVPLAVHCTQKGPELRSFARKGVMCLLYVFSGKQPRDNEGFWNELATSGVATSQDQKKVVGVLLGGEMVMATRADAWIARQYARSLVMADLAQGDKPAVSKVAGEALKLREQATKELRGKYGE
ncbi:MAG: TlpA family protein disulfide reductase [Planctomycetes bacterium]|nr:TlpA family protein disulfide reductase [Planctomycetota bacterium]